MIEYIVITILSTIVIGLLLRNLELKNMNNNTTKTKVNNVNLKTELQELREDLIDTQDELGSEREKNRTLLSQKKSSETRLGQITEHLVPFLEGCPYDPKSLIFLGNPIDFISFDYDQGEIVFLEVKSGNSKASKRQKTIKNIIGAGRVRYAEIRVNEKGVKHKVYSTDDNKS